MTQAIVEMAKIRLQPGVGPDADPASVVDGELRVKGIAGLRVIDCSIMPAIVSGNTNAPAMAIGSKAASIVATAHGAAVESPIS